MARSCRPAVLGLVALLLAQAASAQDTVRIVLPFSDATIAATVHAAVGRVEGTVLLLQGYPGAQEPMPELVRALQVAGRTVFVPHYRGSWNSTGEFSIDNAIEDVTTILAQLRAPGALERFGVGTQPITIVGHSLGSWLALHTAARDPQVLCVAALAPTNFGLLGQQARTDAAFAERLRASIAAGTTGGSIRLAAGDPVAAMSERADSMDIARWANELANRNVLLVTALQDQQAPPEQHAQMLAATVRQLKSTALQYAALDTDHNFATARPLLARTVVEWVEKKCK